MAEIKNVGGQPLPINDPNVSKIGESVKTPSQTPQNPQGDTSVGRGNYGQPVGIPGTVPTTQSELMPGVVTGRDPSQLLAADKLRSNGGFSSTDVLLGLHQQPSMIGVLLAPPGNLEALKHMSPSMRRNILRNLLSKQRGKMHQLVAVMRDERHSGQSNSEQESEFTEEFEGETETSLVPQGFVPNQRAVNDLQATTKMLDLLDELLGMQDYTLSQLGTFSQG